MYIKKHLPLIPLTFFFDSREIFLNLMPTFLFAKVWLKCLSIIMSWVALECRRRKASWLRFVFWAKQDGLVFVVVVVRTVHRQSSAWDEYIGPVFFSPFFACCRRAWFVLRLLSATMSVSLLEEGDISEMHVPCRWQTFIFLAGDRLALLRYTPCRWLNCTAKIYSLPVTDLHC